MVKVLKRSFPLIFYNFSVLEILTSRNSYTKKCAGVMVNDTKVQSNFRIFENRKYRLDVLVLVRALILRKSERSLPRTLIIRYMRVVTKNNKCNQQDKDPRSSGYRHRNYNNMMPDSSNRPIHRLLFLAHFYSIPEHHLTLKLILT